MNTQIERIAGSWNDRVELCISDNCSTDETARVVEKWTNKVPRLKSQRLGANLRAGINYLRALELTSAEYIWYISDDSPIDWSILEEFLAFLEREQPVSSLVMWSHSSVKFRPSKRVYSEIVSFLMDKGSVGETMTLHRTAFHRSLIPEKLYPAYRIAHLEHPFAYFTLGVLAEGVADISIFIPSEDKCEGIRATRKDTQRNISSGPRWRIVSSICAAAKSASTIVGKPYTDLAFRNIVAVQGKQICGSIITDLVGVKPSGASGNWRFLSSLFLKTPRLLPALILLFLWWAFRKVPPLSLVPTFLAVRALRLSYDGESGTTLRQMWQKLLLRKSDPTFEEPKVY